MSKRKYSQDFSEATCGRITDSSYAAAADINNIVRHYEETGIDPFVERKALAQSGEALTTSYEDAMRHKAELDSAFENLTPQERAEHDNSPMAWYQYLGREQASQALSDVPDVTPDPPPEDSTEAESE